MAFVPLRRISEQIGQRCAKLHGLLKSEIMLSGSPTRGVCAGGGGGCVNYNVRGDTCPVSFGCIFVDRTLTREASCRGRSGTRRSLTLGFSWFKANFTQGVGGAWWFGRAMSIDDDCCVCGAFFMKLTYYGAHGADIVGVFFWENCPHTRCTAQYPCLFVETCGTNK